MKKLLLGLFILTIFVIGCAEELPTCEGKVIKKCYKYEKCREEQCQVKVSCDEDYDFYVNVTKAGENCEPLNMRVEK